MLATLSQGSQQVAWVLAGLAAFAGLVLALVGYRQADGVRGPHGYAVACICAYLAIVAVMMVLVLQK